MNSPSPERISIYWLKDLSSVDLESLRRRILATFLSCLEGEIQIERSETGKPILKSPRPTPDVHFSTSHTDDLWVLAVCRGRRIGIDIENRTASEPVLDLAERYYTNEEQILLRETEIERQGELFLASWTKKEALIKARGDAISHGLDRFGTQLMGFSSKQIFYEEGGICGKSWTIRRLDEWNGFLCHLAVENADRFQIEVKELANGYLE